MKGELGGRMGQQSGRRRAVLRAAFSVGLTVAGLAGSAVAVGPATAANKPKPLTAPKTTPVQDAQYLTDVAKADPALVTYLQDRGNAGLRAVLTDGSAFCAFLRRGGGIDNAMVALAAGAQSVQSKTHLPATVRTYNTVESVALLTLCPSELKLVPASDRTRLRKLGKALAPPQG
jgi:hypothetical protein